MSLEDLEQIHSKMLDSLQKQGIKIDLVLYCPHDLNEMCNCRKPEIGLAIRAKEIFPDIDFSKSVMVGDSVSDMEFARKVGMKKVFVNKKTNEFCNADLYVSNLYEFS